MEKPNIKQVELSARDLQKKLNNQLIALESGADLKDFCFILMDNLVKTQQVVMNYMMYEEGYGE